MPLVFIPAVIFPFVFSKLIFFQVLIGLTFPAYLILIWMEPQYRPKAHLLYLAIAAYFIAIALSVIFGVDPMRSWWGNQERMNGLFTLLHFFAWLTMTVGLLRSWPQWRRLLNYEVALSLFMAIVALLQKAKPTLLLFPAGPRVGGLLDNPIYMGAYQIFNLFFLALLAIKNRSKQARIWYGVIALFDVAAFVAAQSRGALIGLAAGIAAFVLYVAVFTKHKKARYGILGFAAVMVVVYGTLFAFRNTPFVRSTSFERLTHFTESMDTRFIAWNIAWQGFLDRPLTGWGFDDFHILFNQKYNPKSLRYGQYETWFDRSHNTILDVLSMTGLLGFLTFAGIFIALFYTSWRAYRKGWIDLPIAAILFGLPVGYFVQNLFVFDHPAVFSMSYLLFALVIAATQGEFVGQIETAKPGETPPGRHAFSWVAFGVLQLLFVVLVWRTSMLPFQASRLAIKSNAYFGTQAGFEYAKQAADIWTPYLDEQTFLLSRNLIVAASQGNLTKLPSWQDQYALAKRLNEEELRRHPLNTHPHFIYAQLALSVSAYVPSEIQLAERQYLAAIDTSPKRQQMYYGLAKLYTGSRRFDAVEDLYHRVRDFDVDFGEGHWLYGLSLFYGNDKNNIFPGAQEIAASQAVAYPYHLQDVRELVALTQAYAVLKDKAGLQKAAGMVKDLPPSTAQFYAQIAALLQGEQLLADRDAVLAFAEKIDPAVRDTFQTFLKQATVKK